MGGITLRSVIYIEASKLDDTGKPTAEKISLQLRKPDQIK